ncbi:MAG: hypothetical protein ACRDQ2_03420 [Gaiellales bacterium]
MSTVSTRRPHRQTTWFLRRNPLPTEAIGRDEYPYSEIAFAAEIGEFCDKVLVGGLSSRRQIAFLYSHNRHGGEDTGFGKSATMLHMRTAINEDLGASLLGGLVDDDELIPVGAAYATFNTKERSGYYPVLASAVYDAATAGEKPLLAHAHERLVAEHGPFHSDLSGAIFASQVKLGVSLRPSTVDAFIGGGAAGVAADVTAASEATKLRSGLQWLHFLLVALHAAEIGRLYLFIDQLEDLATNKSQSRAKRYREIGRIRDLLEDDPTRSMMHTTFTMHDTAAVELEEFWTPHRLPSYELRRANMGQIIRLEGLTSDEAAAEVLGAWLTPERVDGFSGDLCFPFEMSAVRQLRTSAEGRVGPFLTDAAKVFDAAESEKIPVIPGEYVRAVLEDGASSLSAADDDDDDEVATEFDDDLLS